LCVRVGGAVTARFVVTSLVTADPFWRSITCYPLALRVEGAVEATGLFLNIRGGFVTAATSGDARLLVEDDGWLSEIFGPISI